MRIPEHCPHEDCASGIYTYVCMCPVNMGVYKKYSLLYRKIVHVVLDASDFHVGDSENESVIHQVLFTLFRFVEI